METVTEVPEDPPKEMAEGVNRGIVSLERVNAIDRVCTAKRGRPRSSFICICVISLSCIIPMETVTEVPEDPPKEMAEGVNRGIVSLERVNAIDRLHVRLLLDYFTMGVLRELNVAPMQLHLNSWAYMQAFCVLC
ncbi:hypothetical protein DEO72_LG4g252 [Vigna unguiculata]|uniref:Uncharacterized protein n=1 Tax=Vigna unguiculata TaxID=3917 RepID=A0A4D6LLH6_VIGUN|nr:hypothetical protein DEO72_LG4g252 [Vigna unguiculata]